MRLYTSQLNEVLKHTNFPIDSRVEIKIRRRDFEDDFDMYVKQITFDLSPYYDKHFVENVSEFITDFTNKIDNLTNCLTIEDLERLTKKGCEVVFRYTNCGGLNRVLVKVCPKTVKHKGDFDNDGYSYRIDKKDDFICKMPKTMFAIVTDEGTHIIINKTNITEYL